MSDEECVPHSYDFQPLIEVGAFYLDCIVRSDYHFSFSPHIDDLMMHRCGLAKDFYHPSWDEEFPYIKDGTRDCRCLTQLYLEDYL